jgi:hypothetical protein
METKETESTQTSQKAYTSQLLSGLITHASDATARLHTLNEQYPHIFTDTSRIEGQLSGLCEGFRRLSKHHEDARNDLEFDMMQKAVQAICHSAQYTLDDILKVFDTGSDETGWESWTRLTIQMSHLEQAGLHERLQWYLAAVQHTLHRLEGITSVEKISQWLHAHKKIAALLERQEGFLKTSQPATSNTIQLPAPTGFPTDQLPAAPLEASDTNTKSRRPFDGFPIDELPLEALDTNTKSRPPYDGFPTDELPAAPLKVSNTNEVPPSV